MNEYSFKILSFCQVGEGSKRLIQIPLIGNFLMVDGERGRILNGHCTQPDNFCKVFPSHIKDKPIG